MTEEQLWITGNPTAHVPLRMRGIVSARRLQLLTVASCRLIWEQMLPAGRHATAALERFADQPDAEGEYREAVSAADVASRMCVQDPPSLELYAVESPIISSPPTLYAVQYSLSTASTAQAMHAAEPFGDQDYDHAYDVNFTRAVVERSSLLNDLFRIVPQPTLDPTLRTEAVVALARGMYESRDFAPMPVLADALDDAGCTDPDILAHCRGPGPHVRGCWVVDLVLGKK